MKMRDLKELQDEALQDRAWLQTRPDDIILLSAMIKDGLDEIKDEFATPYLLRKQLASGKLKSWLEYKIKEYGKNEQVRSAYEDALQKLRKIPRNATRVEATKALYEAFMGEKVSHELEKCFELEVRFHSLQAEGLNAINEICCIRQKIIKNRDFGLCEQEDALESYVSDISFALTEISDNIIEKDMTKVKKKKTLEEYQEEDRVFMEKFRKRGKEIHDYIDNSLNDLYAEAEELGLSKDDFEKPFPPSYETEGESIAKEIATCNSQESVDYNINPKGAINMDVKDETYIIHKMKEYLNQLSLDFMCELEKLHSPENAKKTHFF